MASDGGLRNIEFLLIFMFGSFTTFRTELHQNILLSWRMCVYPLELEFSTWGPLGDQCMDSLKESMGEIQPLQETSWATQGSHGRGGFRRLDSGGLPGLQSQQPKAKAEVGMGAWG